MGVAKSLADQSVSHVTYLIDIKKHNIVVDFGEVDCALSRLEGQLTDNHRLRRLDCAVYHCTRTLDSLDPLNCQELGPSSEHSIATQRSSHVEFGDKHQSKTHRSSSAN